MFEVKCAIEMQCGLIQRQQRLERLNCRSRPPSGCAAREHFQDPEWRCQSAAALDGEGAMRRRDLDAFERRHDLDLGVFRQTGQQRLIRKVNDRATSAGHEPAGDVILTEDRGLERQLSGVTADWQLQKGGHSVARPAPCLNLAADVVGRKVFRLSRFLRPDWPA